MRLYKGGSAEARNTTRPRFRCVVVDEYQEPRASRSSICSALLAGGTEQQRLRRRRRRPDHLIPWHAVENITELREGLCTGAQLIGWNKLISSTKYSERRQLACSRTTYTGRRETKTLGYRQWQSAPTPCTTEQDRGQTTLPEHHRRNLLRRAQPEPRRALPHERTGQPWLLRPRRPSACIDEAYGAFDLREVGTSTTIWLSSVNHRATCALAIINDLRKCFVKRREESRRAHPQARAFPCQNHPYV